MDRLIAAQELSEQGRFGDAYTALAFAANVEQSPTSELLRSELLERIGRPLEAKSLAEAVLASTETSAAQRSGCELVLGRVAWEQGRSQDAVDHLQRSVTYATQSGDIARLCWAQLRLLVLVAERASADAVAPLLAEVRANAITLADFRFTAALHIGLGEVETKRGLLDIAERHLDVGEEVLATKPNAWLAASAANTRLALAILRSDFALGLKQGDRALAAAEGSGSASVLASVLINLGNIHFLIGAYDRAVEYFDRAERAVPFTLLPKQAINETIARIRLAQGRLEDAETFLTEIDRHRREDEECALYVQRHTELTRISVFVERGRFDEATVLCDQLDSIAGETGDHLLRLNTSLARIEVLLRRGDVASGIESLRSILSLIETAPPDVLARFEGLVACALFASGQRTSAFAHIERARRLLIGIRCEPALTDLKRLWAAKPMPPENGDITTNAEETLHALATVLSVSDRPDLMARELFTVLVNARAIHSGVLLAHERAKTPTTIATHGSFRRRQNSTKLVVGIVGETAYELEVNASDDIGAAMAIQATERLVSALAEVQARRKETQKRLQLWSADEAMIGGSVVNGYFRTVIDQATRVARTNVTVLITGESGTGKEILARAIHGFSPRAAKAFLPFNCTAIPRDLVEGQLFGHRRGAFTGADRDHPGIIRSAAEGTLFLDEIGEFSLDLQPKLLRFLESGEILPLGETHPVKVDVRLVAATNRDLEQLVAEGSFREDLFYRLNVVRLKVPPLRERRDEIPALAEHFVRQAAQEFEKGDIRISPDTLEYLLLYRWPGNIRELANELRRVVVMAERNSTIEPEQLSAFVTTGTIKPAPPGVQPPQPTEVLVRIDQPLARATELLERAMLAYALKQAGGRLEDAASLLGVSRKGLYLKRHRLGLN